MTSSTSLLIMSNPAIASFALSNNYYGKTPHARLQSLVEQAQADNKLNSPNLIFPGRLLKIKVPRQYCAAPQSFPFGPIVLNNDDSWFFQLNHGWQSASVEQRSMSSALAPWLLGTGSSKLMMIEKTFATNTPVLGEMVSNYEDYKADKITKGQYDYQRRKLIGQLKANLGPTRAILQGTKNPSEVLRISRTRGTVPTQSISQQISRMNTLSKIASNGGVALSVVGLGLACQQIAHTDSQREKNEILVGSAGGLAGGVLYGLTATAAIAIMATPVGWVGALIIGVGGALAGVAGSKITGHIYDTRFNHIDFASETGIAHICSSSSVRNGMQTNRKLLSNNALSAL